MLLAPSPQTQEGESAVLPCDGLVKRRVWVVAEGQEGVSSTLLQAGEAVVVGDEEKGREEIINKLQFQLESVSR